MAVPLTTAMQTQIANLYISILGRNPDPVGFGYWCDVYANANGTQAALDAIASGFGKSPEFTGIYSGQTPAAAVALMYNNILGRTQDAAGATYWTGIANGYITSGKTVGDAYALTANAMITAAAANTGTADATLIASKQATAVTAGTSTPVTTYTLTTSSPETIIAQGANTVVNGLLGTGQTLNSFDTITGTGTTTFNLADNTGDAFPGIPVAVSLSGFGTVNLIRSGAAAQSNAVTVTNTTFGAGVKAFNLSNAGNLTTAAGVDITLNSATSVSVVNSAATKYTTVAVTDTATTVTTGSTLTTVSITGSTGNATLTGNGITTVNLNGAATGGTVTIDAATAASTATRALTINISGTTNSAAVTDAKATSVTLNQTSAAVMTTLTVAKATSIAVNTTGTATTAGSETIVGTVATAMTFGGTRANTVTMTAANNPVLATVTVTGTGGVTLGDLSAFTTLTSVDTSQATNVASATGAANLTVANSVTLGTLVSFTGGAGDDQVTVGATTKAINLGTGANKVTLTNGTTAIGTGGSITGDGNDTLAFATAADAATISGGSASAVAAFKAAVTGFSTLELAAIGANTRAINVNNLANTGVITQVNLTGNAAASDLTISNLGSGATIKVTGANTGATTTTAGTTGSGTSDILNLNLTQSSNAAVSFGTFVTPNVENIAFIMGDTQATPVGYYNTATLTNAALFSLTVSGNSGLDLTLGTAATNLQTFNASGVTLGGVKFTSSALQYASTVTGSQKGGDTLNFGSALAAVTLTTTAGTNTVTGATTVASTFTGGSGADTFFGGTGADIVNGNGGADIIYGNNAGTKQIQTATLATNLTATQSVVLTIAGTAITVTGAAGVATPTEVAGAFVTAINTNADLKYVTVASNAAGVITLTNIVDGVISVARTDSASMTVTLGNIGVDAGTRTGTSTTTGADVLTGGAGSDIFFYGISSAAPSSSALQTITDFNAGAVTDYVSYNPAVVALANTVATATNGTAAISANGIATFTSTDSASLASQLTAVAAAIQANTTAAGKSVAFQNGSDAYLFISDGTNGVTAGDVLVKLTGINLTNTATDQLVASGHTITLA